MPSGAPDPSRPWCTEDIADANPGLSVEVARWLSEGVALSLGGSFSRQEPSGTILDSGMIGRIQPKLVAPELAFHAGAARAYAASAMVLAHLAQGAGDLAVAATRHWSSAARTTSPARATQPQTFLCS